MARVSPNGIVQMNRGDKFEFSIPINIGSPVDPVLYKLKPGDFLYLAVMEPNQRWEDALIKKTYDETDFDNDQLCVNAFMEMEDTEYLRPGTYYYQVKLFREHFGCDDGRDHVDTIIDRTKFIILD